VFLSSLTVTALPGSQPPEEISRGAAAPIPPQVFEQNRGQTDPRTAFVSRADGMLFGLDPTGIDIDLGGARGEAPGTGHARLVFQGSNPGTGIAGVEPLEGTVSFFAGADPAGWIRDVPAFGAVRYRGLYAGVDLTVRGDHRRLILAFSLTGGADPDAVDVSFEDESAAEVLRLHRSGGRREVRYTLDRVPDSGIARGAGMAEEIARVVVDRDGRTYVAGRSLSPLAPAGVAAGAEAFVARIDRDGLGPAWVAWFGGAGRDVPLDLAVANDGSVVVVGRTGSADFPLAHAIAAQLAGPSDAFVTILSPDGGALVASTYLGGGGEDEARAVALDADGNAWVAGSGSGAAMLSVVSPEGNRLVRRSAELAAAQAGSIDAIAIDAAGRLHAAGTSGPDPFLATLAADGSGPVAVIPLPMSEAARPTDLALGTDGTFYVVGRRIAEAPGTPERGFAAVVPAALSAEPMVTLLDRVPLAVAAPEGGHAWISGEEFREPPGAAESSSGRGAAASPGDRAAFIARVSALDATVDRVKPIAGSAMARATGLAVDPDGRPIVAGIDRADADGGARLYAAAASGGLVVVREVSIAPAAAGCPGTIRFDNSAGTGLWQTATNWSTDILPGASDDVCIPAGSNVTLSSGPPSIGSLFVESGASFSLSVALTIASASQVDGTLTVSAGGIAGNADLAVNGTFTWNGGALTGAGTTEVNNGMAIGGASIKDLTSSRVLNTHGTVTWTGTGAVRIGSGGTIHNLGTWDSRSDAAFSNLAGAALFDNPAGSTFKKTLGSGTTAVGVPWSGDGAVSVESGTISFNGGGSSDGSFSGLSGATLRFGGGSFTLGTASSVNVPNASVASGTLTVNGSWTTTVSGASSNSTTWTFNPAATLNAIGPALSIAGTLVLNSGEAVNVTSLTMTSGSRQGTDTLSVSGTLAWSGGSFNGASTTNANGPLAISGAPVKDMLGGHVLNTKAATTWTGTGSVRMGGGSLIRNTGAWESQSDAQINDTLSGGGSFDNQNGAIFTKKVAAGTTSLNLPVGNAGSIAVETGAIALGGGGSGPGSYSGLAGTTLRFSGGSYTLDAASTLDVPNVVVSAGDLSVLGSFTASSSTGISGGGTAAFEPSATLVGLGALSVGGGVLDLRSGEAVNLPSASISAGNLQGTDVISVAGLTSWSGGAIGGAAAFNANGDMAIGGASVKDLVDGRTLNTTGTVTWSSTGSIRTRNSSIRNAGLWQAQSDAQVNDVLGAGGTFDNQAGATFRKTAGSGETQFAMPLVNHGTIEIQSGVILVSAGGNCTAAITGSAGTTFKVVLEPFSLDSGSSFQVSSVEVGNSGTIEVHGTFLAATSTTLGTSGTLTLLPEATVTSVGTALAMGGGTLDLRSGETIDVTTLTVSAGILKGSDTVNVSGAFTWSGGALTESGIVNANGGGTISAPQVKDITGGRILNTAGTLTWTGTGVIRMGTGAVIHNSGTWNAQTDAQINDLLGGAALFDNTASGTFLRSGGTGTMNLTVDVTNAGAFRVQTGTLQFSTSYTQTAGSLSLEGGAVLASVPLAIQGGSLAGSGTVTGNVNMNGHLAPGLSPGSLTITGTLAPTAASAFDVEIGGLTPATQHDRAVLNTAAVLAGTLNVSLIDGFVPADLDIFTILTFPSATGTFPTVNTPVLPGGLVWQIFYTPTTVFLKVISDIDGDGVSNLVDCAPSDPTAWSMPAEISGVAFGTNNQTISWTSLAAQAGPGIIYDLMRGLISQLPTGGKPAETCLAPDSGSTQFVETDTPAVGAGFYYLVRGSNVCGVGTYGTTSGGASRNTAVCP